MYSRKRDKLIEALDPFRRIRHKNFPAIKNISFSVKPGESLGIMGVNGSGKSTLLKLLCRVITPTSGKLSINGKVSALLELGAGFHPDRTGMENLYFQGAIQGFSRKETEEMIPDILAFADIGEFINQPIKIYSSGMFVRLAFAAAIQTRPDILIVDEALAVGDVRFQRRCFSHIEKMKAQGVTFIFVSHATEQIITQCTRALLLSHGEICMDGEPGKVANRYLDFLFGKSDPILQNKPLENKKTIEINPENSANSVNKSSVEPELLAFFQDNSLEDRYASHPLYNRYEYRWGNGSAKILDIYLASTGNPMDIHPGDHLTLHVKACFYETCFRPIWGCTVKNHEGVTVYGTNSEINGSLCPYESAPAGTIAHVAFTFTCNLGPGDYFISLGLATEAGNIPLDRRYDSLLLSVHPPANFFGLGDLHMTIQREEIPHA